MHTDADLPLPLPLPAPAPAQAGQDLRCRRMARDLGCYAAKALQGQFARLAPGGGGAHSTHLLKALVSLLASQREDAWVAAITQGEAQRPYVRNAAGVPCCRCCCACWRRCHAATPASASKCASPRASHSTSTELVAAAGDLRGDRDAAELLGYCLALPLWSSLEQQRFWKVCTAPLPPALRRGGWASRRPTALCHAFRSGMHAAASADTAVRLPLVARPLLCRMCGKPGATSRRCRRRQRLPRRGRTCSRRRRACTPRSHRSSRRRRSRQVAFRPKCRAEQRLGWGQLAADGKGPQHLSCCLHAL